MARDGGLLDAVQQRLRHLIAEREQLDVAIAELRRIVKSADAMKTVVVAGTIHERAEQDSPANGKHPGLRATLCSSIAAHNGLTREEAIGLVEESGFRPSGTTPVRVLVTSELYRLAKNGTLEKTPRGQYVMAKEG